jgi:uncharacterized protein YjbI with pentapeptide repeats
VAKAGRGADKATSAVSADVRAKEAVDKRRRRGPSRLAVWLILLAVLAIAALVAVPALQVWPARQALLNADQLAPADRLALENQLFESENAARTTLAIILGAAGALLAAGIIWRRFEKSRELKMHDRFAKAVEQLGSERGDGTARTEARLGGIYELERLVQESEHEYWPVMEVLTAYVRDNAPWRPTDVDARTGHGPGPPPRPSADIQAVLAVLGRRRPPTHSSDGFDKRLLDLRETDLRGANLSGSRLEGMSMYGTHLEHVDATRAVLGRSNLREAWLTGATLTEVDLAGASLSKANLEGARLNRANLQGADLSGANLRGADLWEANLKACNLKDADLRGADLSACVLEEAILWRADLQDAVLTGTRLRETHLERANLAGVSGLTWQQGEDAYTDENTILPDYLVSEGGPVGPAAPAPPTPAARRTLSARAAVTRSVPKSQPLEAPPPERPDAAPLPEIDSSVEALSPNGTAQPAVADAEDVVQLNPPPPAPPKRTRAARPKPDGQVAQPKKAAVPRHRKPRLVNPG